MVRADSADPGGIRVSVSESAHILMTDHMVHASGTGVSYE